MKYIPINIKTNYEILSSLIKIEDLVLFCKNNNINCVGITDSNMFYCMEAYNILKDNNIKLLIGTYIEKYNLYLYALNYNGYISLCNIVSKRNIDNISLEEIIGYRDIIIVCSFEDYNNINYNNKYIGYTTIDEKNEALKYTSNIVYNPVMKCISKEDNKYLKYLECIKDKKNVSECKDYYNHYFNEINESDAFNTYKFSELINIEFPKSSYYIPVYCDNSSEFLRNLSTKGLYKRLNNNVSTEYINRLNYELSVIESMGFVDYFLIVYDYILYAKKNNIYVGPGRGSAAGSLVSYTLGITEIDPLKYNLIFERFLNPDRITMPDIDVDFDSENRYKVIDYVKNKYGFDKVSNIIAFDTFLPKQALKDMSKVLNVNSDLVDRLCKTIDKEKNFEELKNNIEYNRLINRESILLSLESEAKHICNLKRNTSIHAAGVVISSKCLSDIMPMYKNNDIILTGYTKEYIESLGLLKMDFLSLQNLNTIVSILNRLKSDNININLNRVPLNDTKTLDLFKNAKTSGIFQFESNLVVNFLRKTKPSSFIELINTIAICRPGPMNQINTYVARKNNKEKVSYLVKELEPILKDTYGIIIFQEQVLEILRLLAGYSYSNADIIRKAMSKKQRDIIENEKSNFINGIISKGYSKNIAESLYNQIIEFSSYGFNKSHSVVYSFVAYQMAFLKANYPLYFMCELLNSSKLSDSYKKYLEECKTYNIKLIKVNINLSRKDYVINNNSLIMPYSSIKGISTEISRVIEEERNNGLFKDIYDFLLRMFKKINKKTIISLVESGAFDEFNLCKRKFIENYDIINNYIELCYNLGTSHIDKPYLNDVPEYSLRELIDLEFKNFGMYINTHAVVSYDRSNDILLNNISNYVNKDITVTLLVNDIRTINTKKGQKMSYVSLSDEYRFIEGIIFPSKFDSINISVNSVYRFYVRVVREEDYKLIINDVLSK